jgi:hypothetical protein
VLLSRSLLLGSEAGASPTLHFLGQLTHGFLRDDTPLPSGKRGFRLVDRGKNFRAGALALFPEGQRLLTTRLPRAAGVRSQEPDEETLAGLG